MANILEYLPPPLQVIREFTAIATAENPELTQLWASLEDAFKDQFIDEATVIGIKRWEEQLQLSPKGTDTLDERRFRIKAKINEQPPYTYRALEQQLTALCGADGYTLDVDVAGYSVTIKLALTSSQALEDVTSLTERIVPLNMILDLSLLYNQHLTLGQFTHAHLGLFTHDQLRSDALDQMTYSMLEGVAINKLEGVM